MKFEFFNEHPDRLLVFRRCAPPTTAGEAAGSTLAAAVGSGTGANPIKISDDDDGEEDDEVRVIVAVAKSVKSNVARFQLTSATTSQAGRFIPGDKEEVWRKAEGGGSGEEDDGVLATLSSPVVIRILDEQGKEVVRARPVFLADESRMNLDTDGRVGGLWRPDSNTKRTRGPEFNRKRRETHKRNVSLGGNEEALSNA